MKNLLITALVLTMATQVFAGTPVGKGIKAKAHSGKSGKGSCNGVCPYYNPKTGTTAMPTRMT